MLFSQGFQFPQIGMPTGAGAELPGVMPAPMTMFDDFLEGANAAQSTSILPYALVNTGTALANNSYVSVPNDSYGVNNVVTQSPSAAADEVSLRTRGTIHLFANKPMSCFARVRSGGSTATHHVVWGLWSNADAAIAIAQARGIGFKFINGAIQIGARNDNTTVAFASAATYTASVFYNLAIVTDGIKHQFYVDSLKVGEITLDCLKTGGASSSGVYSMGLSCGTDTTTQSRCGIDYWGMSAVR